MQHRNTIIVIAGPTAVGKTAISIELAEQLHTEIVSADSRQCYTGMAIGTAQPDASELARVPHHFINCFPVTTALSAADYERLALRHLEDIFRRHTVAVVCGGTGLYIKALCEGLDDMPAVNEDTAREVQAAFEEQGLEWLQQAVRDEDPVFFSKGESLNPARLVRALVFVRSTGKSITIYQNGIRKERPFNMIKIGLELPRELLYERINKRVDIMMAQGLESEARELYPMRYLKNLQTVGYSELFDYFDGTTDLATAITLIRQHSRNYAKRQLTWFKKDPEMNWLTADAAAAGHILKAVPGIL